MAEWRYKVFFFFSTGGYRVTKQINPHIHISQFHTFSLHHLTIPPPHLSIQLGTKKHAVLFPQRPPYFSFKSCRDPEGL